jgi:NADPH-dependent glutamate synthase beta subunit-like oxidoreductase
MTPGERVEWGWNSTKGKILCYTAQVMADADVIIIGSGMAGLTCGCLLAKKGLKVLMIEKNQRGGSGPPACPYHARFGACR